MNHCNRCTRLLQCMSQQLTQLRHRLMGQSHAQKRGRYQLPCIVDMMPCSEFEYP